MDEFRLFRKEDLENFQKAMLGLDEEDNSSDVSETIHTCLEKSDEVEKMNLEAASFLKNDKDKEENRVQFEMQSQNCYERTTFERIHNDLEPINVDMLSIKQEIAIPPQEELERIRRSSFGSQAQEEMFRRKEDQGLKTVYNNHIRPQHNDVLSGRIPGIPTHPGNDYYRHLVKLNKVNYITSSSSEKKNIISFIMNKILNKRPSGRFLKASSEDRKITYTAMSAAEVKRKIGQALRENAPRLRKEIMQRAKTTKSQFEKRHSPSNYLMPSQSIPSSRHPASNTGLQYDMRKVSLLRDTATKQVAQTRNYTTYTAPTNRTHFPYNLLNGVSDMHIWDQESNLDEKPASGDINTKSDGRGSFSRHTAAVRVYGDSQKTEVFKKFDEEPSDD
ncbi:hypothetical protein CTEN210_12769 [Chaetoceros tenuissimus]|uniref:DUF6824 domain-containing protein n=1 Tax=Chaetoceros tenuissimus TaxID=426638 RepID=A0AAD3D270_9STRA|nr:hypothetical protein CTEN210_12769 [Chaetoceros tenuissimus]